jgi:phenylacetate-CoA ligase
MDPEARGQIQLERLQSVLNRAFKNVPFYRNHFRSAGCSDPACVETLDGLRQIPFTRQDHLSENYPYGLFAVPLRDVARIHTAPGSGLLPTVSGYTRQDLSLWRHLVARALSASGVSASDILQVELDPGLANWGRDYKDGAERLDAGVIPLTTLSPEKQVMVLRDYRTTVLITSASAANQLMRVIFRSNINPNVLALKTLVLVGEAPDPGSRAQIEERLHVSTWVHYGLSEVPGPAIAFECEARDGLHVSEDHFLVEVIDPGTGASLPEGAEGELILTTLTTRAFPLIRFPTGDRVRLLTGACSCGRTLKRLEWLPDRAADSIVIRGVKVHQRSVLLLIERFLGFAPENFRLMVKSRDLMEYLEVWLPAGERLFSDEIKNIEKLLQNLGLELTRELGVPVAVRLREKASLEARPKTLLRDPG